MYSSGCLHLMLLSSARGYIYLICTDREYINTLQWCMAEWLLANGTQNMLCVWCARGHVREMCRPDVYVRPLVIIVISLSSLLYLYLLREYSTDGGDWFMSFSLLVSCQSCADHLTGHQFDVPSKCSLCGIVFGSTYMYHCTTSMA